MAKKIPPTGWRPVRGEGNSKRLNYTTLWFYLQAADDLLLPCLALADTFLREVVG
jgi:hypothetical protein